MYCKVKRVLSFIMALVLVASTLPFPAFADEGAAGALEQVRNEIAAYNAHYGLNANMTDDEMAQVIFGINESEPLVFTWVDEIVAISQNLTEEEWALVLVDENTVVFGRFYNVLESIYTPAAVAAKPTTILDGDVTIKDSSGTGSGDATSYTITQKSSISSLLGERKNTITITNTSGSKAKISFGITVTDASTFTIDGAAPTSSSYSKSLAPNGTISITLGAIAGLFGQTTATLVMTNFSCEPLFDANVTFDYNSNLGNIAVNGNTVTVGSSVEISSEGATLTASPASGASFGAWVDGNNKLLSIDPTYSFVPTAANMSIRAIFGSNTAEANWLSSDGYVYDNMVAAFEKGAVVTLINEAKLTAGDYAVPSGKTLLIPYNGNHTLCTTLPTEESGYEKPTFYRTLIMENGAHLTVNGTLSLSARQSAADTTNGAPSHTISRIHTEEGSTITVNGNLYAWGLITGSGTVTANSSAKIYEGFQVGDWRGGAKSMGMENHVFPFSQYTFRNIEVPLTLYSGAAVYGVTSVDVAIVGLKQITFPMIAKSGSMFNLTSGYMVKDYDGSRDKDILTIHGNMDLIGVGVQVSVYTMDTTTNVFYLPGNYEFNIVSGTVTSQQDLAVLPGARIVIEEGATMILKDKGSGSNPSKIVVFDKDEWFGKNYVDAEGVDFRSFSYSYERGSKVITQADIDKDAYVCVDGELIATEGYLYTTKGGANICSSGTGKITLAAIGTSQNYQYNQPADKYDEIPIYSATLTNGQAAKDKQTATTGASGTVTYIYNHDTWLASDHTDEVKYTDITNSSHILRHACCDAVIESVNHTFAAPDYTCECGYLKDVTITFNTDGGNTIDPITNKFGSAVTAPADPTKEGHTFSGWDKEIPATMPGEDMTITAGWKVNQYTLVFQDEAGNVLQTVTDVYGAAVTAPDAPAKTGHTFAGWSVPCETMPAAPEVNGTTVVTPVYSVNQYTITLDTNGGDPMTAITQDYDTAVSVGTPTRTGYAFTGWTPAAPATMPAENMTLTAQWEIGTFTITFNTNGGSAVEAITGEYNTPVTAPADPTKDGYTFAGWDKTYTTIPGENVTVNAQWTPNKYTITFDTDGGSEIAAITQDYGTAVNVSEPTKTGYTFAGWTPEIPATMPAKDMDVKANWTVNQYTITFVGAEIDPITADYGAEVTAPADPTKEGHTFAGWDVDIPTTMPAGDMTITANWNVNEYTVTWIVEGVESTTTVKYGEEITQPEAPTKAQEGCTTYTFSAWTPNVPDTMPAEALIFTALFVEGEKIHEWDSEISYEWIEAGEGYTVTATRTCVRNCGASETATGSASYSMDTEANCQVGEIGTWTASFDAAWAGEDTQKVTGTTNPDVHASEKFIYTVHTDGTHTKKYACCQAEVESNVAHDYENDAYKCECGDVKNIPISWMVDGEVYFENAIKFGTTILKPADPAKEGYTFTGWYTAKTDGDKLAEDAVCDGTTAYYAQFTINKYTISFNTDGGNEIEAITANYGTTVTAPADPTKTGYTFAGWDVEIPAIMPAGDVTVTAQWTINQYTITFNTDGGTEIKPITLDYNSAVTAPENPTKTGYKFISWDKTIPTTMPAEDVTITAKWEIKTYQVKWMNGDTPFATQNYDFGATITKPTNEPVKTGEVDKCMTYEFTGWAGYTEGMTMPDEENLVFTAQYQEVIKHTLEKTEHKDATCTADGNIAYWTCKNCSKIFNSEEATTELTAAQIVISKTNHKLVQTTAKTASCTETGNNEYWSCVDCKRIFKDAMGETSTTIEAETIDKLGHNMTAVKEQAATCATSGNNAYWFCERCEKAFKDADGAVETTVEAETIAALNHGNVTEATKWESDDAGHWQTCPKCSEKVNSGEHEFVDGVCSTCGKLAVPDYHVVLDTMSLSYESEILAQLMVVLPDELLKVENAKLVLTKAGKSGPVEQVYSAADLRSMNRDSKGRHVVEIGLASPEYGRMIKIEVFDGQGNAITWFNKRGVELGTAPEVCAVDYAKAILTSSAFSQQEKDLVTALLTYGGYAQKFFDVDVSEPVYNNLEALGITVPDISSVTADLVGHKASQNDVQNGVTVNAFDVVLDSATSFKMYFSLSAGEDPNNYDFALTYIEAGKEKTKPITATFNNADRRFCVEIEDVAAAYWDYMYKVAITNKATGSTYEFSASILAWVRQVIRKPQSTEQLNLAQAMYLYNQAANVFFKK